MQHGWRPGYVLIGLDGEIVRSPDHEVLIADNRFPPLAVVSTSSRLVREGYLTTSPYFSAAEWGSGSLALFNSEWQVAMVVFNLTMPTVAKWQTEVSSYRFTPETVKAYHITAAYSTVDGGADVDAFQLWLGDADSTPASGNNEPWTGTGWQMLTLLTVDGSPHTVLFDLPPETESFRLAIVVDTTTGRPSDQSQVSLTGVSVTIEYNGAKQ